MSVAVVAFGAVSALGEGAAAASAGEPGEPARVAITRDDELAEAGLARPFVARARAEGSADRASTLLVRAATLCAEDLDRALPRWRALRVGIAVGTSSGGLRSAEPVFARLRSSPSGGPSGEPAEVFYFAPLLAAAGRLGVALAPATLVLGACAASAIAVGLGKRWLEDGRCDVVLAGGFDAVSVLVAAGFESLRATTAEPPPRPFRLARDGMALGEGAALLALVTARLASATGCRPRLWVTGFGASADAVHLTAPDRTGRGLARAASAALDEAGRPEIDLVSAHATATPYSDAAEAKAIVEALGLEAARRAVVHPFKAQAGHTLGASGALEALVCLDAIERGVLPAAAGDGPMDPETPVRLLRVAERGAPRTALKLSAAFGGANAALVLSAAGGSAPAPERRPVYASLAVHVASEPDAATLAVELGQPLEKVARADGLTRLALAAVARLAREGAAAGAPPLSGAGIVVGEAFGTLETDATFYARIVERGARMAEPRRFPFTSPNAAAGECGVVFGLSGPGFAVGAGPCAGLEALAVAGDLVRAGDADRVVVVASDHVGPAVRSIAERLGLVATPGGVALLLSCEPSGSSFRVEETRLALAPWGPLPTHGTGHTALLPLTEPGGERRLSSGGPVGPAAGRWAVEATARLVPFR